ncbi:MAG: L-asparagine oxygenase [Actinomycetota bacterium]|jgi:L-asparagine oxygenase
MATTLLPAVPTVHVPPEDAEQLLMKAERLAAFDPVIDPDAFVLEAQGLAITLTEPVRRALLSFRRHGHPSGGLLVRGLPTGVVPPTPDSADEAMGIHLPAARVMSIAVAALGDQFGFSAELRGRIIHDILGVAGHEEEQSSISSEVLLVVHNETAFTEARPDFVSLFCLRADPRGGGATLLAGVGRALAQIDAASRELLASARFQTSVDLSFVRDRSPQEKLYAGPMAVLSGTPRRPRTRCDFAETRGLDPDAEAALASLHAAASAAAVEIYLEPGDLLLIANHEAFHGRSPFAARHDGRDRWLLRSFITADLSRSLSERPDDGRVVEPDLPVADAS